MIRKKVIDDGRNITFRSRRERLNEIKSTKREKNGDISVENIKKDRILNGNT